MYPAYPSHMNMDLTSPKPFYHPWPYGSYPPLPHQYHACCNHPYSPYGFCPPSPSFHPHGFYPPPFPGPTYPPPYSPIPPQHYSLQQPRYDYDKNNHSTHHCCGCNHQEDDHKKPDIKEESQADKKTSDPLIPLLLKDSPDHPIMWLPRGYTEPKAKENYSHDPVSVKHHEPSKRDGNGEEGGDGNRFPFQIFWLPSKNDEVGKENNLDLVANKGLSDTNNNEGERETIKKHAVEKAKQASTNKEETSSKHIVQKVIPVKQASTNEEKKALKSVDTVANSDSPRTSKLPPVCLRIDPLPKKKKSSRSPSPAEKERPSDVNSPMPSQQQAQVLKKSNEERSEGNHAKRDNHGDNEQRGKVKEENNLLEHANEVKLDAHEANVPREKGDENEKEKKKNLSEHEAALIIQSVYRGFEVRKSQPLKKLRQIYEVKKQFFELRNRIQDLETSSCTDGKKQVIIGETIMSLLLKLDTIQGLHPFVREVRKSVAKELVGLQEKLDTLSFVKSETPTEGTMCSPQQDEVDAMEKNDRASSCENHATESQCDDDAEASIQDKTPTESDIDICKNQEVEGKFNQEVTESNEALELCENQEVGANESQEGIGELKLDKEQLDEPEKEKFHQTPTESNNEALESCENQEVGATESQEGIGEPQLELDKEKLDGAATECDEVVELSENHEVEVKESQEGRGELQLELHKQTHEVKATDCVDNEAHDSNNNQLQMPVENEVHVDNPIQDLVPDDTTMNDSDVSQRHEADDNVADNNMVVSSGHGDDENAQTDDVSIKSELPKANEVPIQEGGLVEENEKLRMAVQELMKAGKEQLGVIRELTGRVKDLEKKLSKKKKKIKVNKCRRSCVVQKD